MSCYEFLAYAPTAPGLCGVDVAACRCERPVVWHLPPLRPAGLPPGGGLLRRLSARTTCEEDRMSDIERADPSRATVEIVPGVWLIQLAREAVSRR